MPAILKSRTSWQLKAMPGTSLKKKSNCDATLQKIILYNPNLDSVNDNVYTKFGLNKSILSQDIEQKLSSDINKGS